MQIDGDAHGFVPVLEKVTQHGSVVDTFQSPTTRFRVVGWPGDRITFEDVPPSGGLPGALSIGVTSSESKNGPNVNRYQQSGRTPIGDLQDLGATYNEAVSATANTPIPDSSAQLAMVRTRSSDVPIGRYDLTPPTPTPWQYQCFSVSQNYHPELGEYQFQGYGCGTWYKVSDNGKGDWWVESYYHVSVHMPHWWNWSFDGLAMKVTYPAGNELVDWSPRGVYPYGSCGSASMGVSAYGFSLSGNMPVCPASAGLWTLSSVASGSGWWGYVDSSDYRNVEGLQAMHSPPTAPYSRTMAYVIWF